jgi:uncharacterized membrane protein YkoI
MKRTFRWLAALILAAALGSANCAAAHVVPKITMEQARTVALRAVPGGIIKGAELEKEKGRWIYSFDIRDGKTLREVWVSPETGELLLDAIEK